uniref:Uncharacterized protein n=1 Tax=Marseillevirus LCMAC202 TaxID=2506606 RepID=A0A481YZN4_9VIRU|nr:MAG: hypothetical protein LCMAC202_03450 [Marseillevirus LCMAC202]
MLFLNAVAGVRRSCAALEGTLCFRNKYLITANGEREMNKEDYPPLMWEMARVQGLVREVEGRGVRRRDQDGVGL